MTQQLPTKRIKLQLKQLEARTDGKWKKFGKKSGPLTLPDSDSTLATLRRQRVEAKLHHVKCKQLPKLMKRAKAFVIQRLVKQIKDARVRASESERESALSAEELASLETELVAAKGTSHVELASWSFHHALLDEYLKTTLVSLQLTLASSVSLDESAFLRIRASKAFQDAMTATRTELTTFLKRLLHEQPVDAPAKKPRLDQVTREQEQKPTREPRREQRQMSTRETKTELKTELKREQRQMSTRETKTELKREKRQMSTRETKRPSADQSFFMESLAVDSDSDAEASDGRDEREYASKVVFTDDDDEGQSELSDNEPQPTRKRNRLGQVARRRLAERMHGQQAKHLQEGGMSVQEREAARLKKAQERRARTARQKTDATKSSNQSSGLDPKLHPSWAAKLQQRSKINQATFQGTKTRFDDQKATIPTVTRQPSAIDPKLHPSWAAKLQQQNRTNQAAFQGTKIKFADE